MFLLTWALKSEDRHQLNEWIIGNRYIWRVGTVTCPAVRQAFRVRNQLSKVIFCWLGQKIFLLFSVFSWQHQNSASERWSLTQQTKLSAVWICSQSRGCQAQCPDNVCHIIKAFMHTKVWTDLCHGKNNLCSWMLLSTFHWTWKRNWNWHVGSFS